jgi:glycosyltransferase 2 family protein
MDKQKLWDYIKLFLKFGLTVLLLYLVFRNININDLKRLFLSSNPFYIALAFVFYFLALIVACWRNLTFLKNIGLNLDFGFSFRLYMLGAFYNISLPGGIGGDGYKIYILRKKYQLPTKRIFLAMFFDRLSGLWAVGFLAVCLTIFIPKLPATLPIIALLIGTAIYYFIMRKYFRDYARQFIYTHLKAGLIQALQVMTVIAILLSQDFDGKFSPYLFSFLVATVAANVPISLGGVGVREYVMTHASHYFGMDYNLAVFIAVTFFIISTLSALTGVWFVYHSREFGQLPSEKEAKALTKKTEETL